MKWEISGPEAVIGGIPYPDHTSQAGSFAFVNLANGNINDKGRLVSQNNKPSGPECLQFWYYSNRAEYSFGTLNVLKFSEQIYSTPLWSQNSFEFNDWQFGQVQIGDSRNEFLFIFEVIKSGFSTNAFISIDDVILKSDACKL